LKAMTKYVIVWGALVATFGSAGKRRVRVYTKNT
jgi:hypothetical protein